MLAALAFVALPLWRITHAGPIASVAPADAANLISVTIRAEFLPGAPGEFEIQHLGKTVWRGGLVSDVTSPPIKLPFPAEGIDLRFRVRWRDPNPATAARLTLIRPEGAKIERSAWGGPDGQMDEVFTFN